MTDRLEDSAAAATSTDADPGEGLGLATPGAHEGAEAGSVGDSTMPKDERMQGSETSADVPEGATEGQRFLIENAAQRVDEPDLSGAVAGSTGSAAGGGTGGTSAGTGSEVSASGGTSSSGTSSSGTASGGTSSGGTGSLEAPATGATSPDDAPVGGGGAPGVGRSVDVRDNPGTADAPAGLDDDDVETAHPGRHLG